MSVEEMEGVFRNGGGLNEMGRFERNGWCIYKKVEMYLSCLGCLDK